MQLSQPTRLHPLIAAAAASIIVVCMLGVAVLAYMLPFRKDGGNALASFLSLGSASTQAAIQLPATRGLPAGFGSTGSVIVTIPPTASTAPGASASGVSSSASVKPVPTRPASAVPAFDVPEPPATKPLPIPDSLPEASSSFVQAEPHPSAPPKAKGLSAAQRDAARRATDALASGRTVESSGSSSELPAKLRPAQLEAARRATAVLAQAAREQAVQKTP